MDVFLHLNRTSRSSRGEMEITRMPRVDLLFELHQLRKLQASPLALLCFKLIIQFPLMKGGGGGGGGGGEPTTLIHY